MHVNEFEAKTIYEKNFAKRREVGDCWALKTE